MISLMKLWPTFAMLIFMVLTVSVSHAVTAPSSITIAGLFPMQGGWSGGQQVRPAAELALSRINADSTLLPNTNLVLRPADTKCSADAGLQAAISTLNQDSSNPPRMILGAGCSGVCEMVTRYAKIKKTPMASFACTSPIFSDSDEFPFFVRTSVTDEAYANAWLAMAKQNNWTKVATIGETQAISSQTISKFEELATQEGIEVRTLKFQRKE